MSTQHHEESVVDSGLEAARPPSLYHVLLINDDYTPMEFVIRVLETFFAMNRERATLVMLKVHNEGVGLAGIYPKDIAETKVRQVVEYAREHQHPLQCVMEENR
jgi:ATP-dependent Clp protease adaptor protein ClpS